MHRKAVAVALCFSARGVQPSATALICSTSQRLGVLTTVLLLARFNSDELLSCHQPGWACFVYALKRLLSPMLRSMPNCLASEKLCLLRGQEKGHSMVQKMCEMWSRLVGRMRRGPELSFMCSVHDLLSLFHRLVPTDP